MSDEQAVIVGSDHAGYEMKEFVKEKLAERSIPFKDVGAHTAEEPSDYPIYASKVAAAVSAGAYKRGIVVCGAGMGSSMVANRFPRVRASLCSAAFMAKLSRAHNDSNILVLGARFTSEWLAQEILQTWLDTEFEGGRHAERVKLIDDTTKLTIAFSHLNNIDPDSVEADAVDQTLVTKALKGLEAIKKLFAGEERRGEATGRSARASATTFVLDGVNYSATMLDLSEKGAQFKLEETKPPPIFTLDDEIEFAVRTPYGPSTCKGTAKWISRDSRSFGVRFTQVSDDPEDPLRLLLDSAL